MLLLLLAFSVAILAVLLAGAKSYKTLTQRDRQTQDQRICELYLSNRIRQTGTTSSMWLEQYEGTQCLEIASEIDGKDYLTRIYCWDGWIRELFTAADYSFRPEDGEKVTEAQSLRFDAQGGLLDVWVKVNGEERQLAFAWEEAGHDE